MFKKLLIPVLVIGLSIISFQCKGKPAPSDKEKKDSKLMTEKKEDKKDDSKKGSYPAHKVVYHFNRPSYKKTLGGLRNIQNHINALGKGNVTVKAVFHGNGVMTILNTPKDVDLANSNLSKQIQKRIKSLKALGVEFNICKNTLKGKKIKITDVFDAKESDIVPSGVAELAHLQLTQGFKYVKP